MKNQPIILLVIAVGCGLVAMLGVKKVISQKPVETVETVKVLSAIADIQPGAPLNDVNTKFVDIAVTSVPEGAVTDLKDIQERYLKVPVMAGDWILKNKLTEFRGAVANLPDGMAAVAIPVDATTSHSGMLLPGNRIDLVLTFTEQGAEGASHQKTITVLEFVEVFAVDNRVYGTDDAGEGQAKNISLLVTPDQAKAVILAGRIGTLSTIMRARGGDDVQGRAEISQEFLTSSFLGSNADKPSVMDGRRDSEDEGDILPPVETVKAEEPEPTQSVNELLDLEMGSEPGVDPGGSFRVAQEDVFDENVWRMEIHVGDEVRTELIRVASESSEAGKPAGNWSIWDAFKN